MDLFENRPRSAAARARSARKTNEKLKRKLRFPANTNLLVCHHERYDLFFFYKRGTVFLIKILKSRFAFGCQETACVADFSFHTSESRCKSIWVSCFNERIPHAYL